MKKYKAGTLLTAQSKKSPINFDFLKFYNKKYIKKSEEVWDEYGKEEESDEDTMFKKALTKLRSKKNICNLLILPYAQTDL